MPRPNIWIVGDWQQQPFAQAMAWLHAQASCAACCSVDEARSVAQCPTAIVLIQSRPGQITSEEVEHWHAASPLARLIALVGPWCEGEMRSGQPWPGVVRIPWRAWPSRLPRELGMARFASGARLPRTATEVERLESSITGLHRRPARSLRAKICTSSRTEFELLRDAMARLGTPVTWQQPGPGSRDSPADVSLIDGWENVGEVAGPRARRILLLHFPRPEDADRAGALGIESVLARPLLLADLAAALDEVVPVAAESRESAA